MPGDSGVLVYSCAFLPMQSAHEPAGAAGTRRSPRPLLGGRFMHNSGASRRGVVKSYLKFDPSLPAKNAKRWRKGALATKQSIRSLRGKMDCFASLAMTAQRLIVCGCLKLGSRHCEERSDEAIHSFFARLDGLLRFARNDGSTPGLSVAV